MQANRLLLSDEGKNAIKAFRDAKPWKGTFEERKEKLETFANAFRDACGLECDFVFVGARDGIEAPHGNGMYHPQANKVVLSDKLSVVTLLFAFGMAAGLNRVEALTWAKGLFRHYFPRSAANCVEVGGLMVKRRETAEEIEDDGDEEE